LSDKNRRDASHIRDVNNRKRKDVNNRRIPATAEAPSKTAWYLIQQESQPQKRETSNCKDSGVIDTSGKFVTRIIDTGG
jgi:hypothetical protein